MQEFIDLLREYWEMMLKVGPNYLNHADAPVNMIFRHLAIKIARELTVTRNVNQKYTNQLSLLMPTLDFDLFKLKSTPLKPAEYVLSDDHQRLIHVYDVLEKLNEEGYNQVASGLSPSEFSSVINHCKYSAILADSIQDAQKNNKEFILPAYEQWAKGILKGNHSVQPQFIEGGVSALRKIVYPKLTDKNSLLSTLDDLLDAEVEPFFNDVNHAELQSFLIKEKQTFQLALKESDAYVGTEKHAAKVLFAYLTLYRKELEQRKDPHKTMAGKVFHYPNVIQSQCIGWMDDFYWMSLKDHESKNETSFCISRFWSFISSERMKEHKPALNDRPLWLWDSNLKAIADQVKVAADPAYRAVKKSAGAEGERVGGNFYITNRMYFVYPD